VFVEEREQFLLEGVLLVMGFLAVDVPRNTFDPRLADAEGRVLLFCHAKFGTRVLTQTEEFVFTVRTASAVAIVGGREMSMCR
jgi:hypothetical protein